MTTYGVIADIHGNLEALDAALSLLDRQKVDRVVCLGDIVGYNANPNECVETLARRGIDSVIGNHELVALGQLDFSRCSKKAAYALARTRRTLTDLSRAFLSSLPPMRAYDDGLVLIHGSIDDPCHYLTSDALVEAAAARLVAKIPNAWICLFGHTHTRRAYTIRNGTSCQQRFVGEAMQTTLSRDGGAVHFVNPGSVDASRKSPPRVAEVASVDTTTGLVRFFELSYDDARVETKSVRGGYRVPLSTRTLDTSLRWAKMGAAKTRNALMAFAGAARK